MNINILVIATAIILVIAFVYFVIKRNKKDQKDLEKEINEREDFPDRHSDPRI
jgi:hypothetical protein